MFVYFACHSARDVLSSRGGGGGTSTHQLEASVLREGGEEGA